MEAAQDVDMSNDVVRFCVSWTTMNVIAPSLMRVVASWNNHRIPGPRGGIPNDLALSVRDITSPLLYRTLTADKAIQLFTGSGGHLTPESCFGVDPIDHFTKLKGLRERDFRTAFPSLETVLENVLHSDGIICFDSPLDTLLS